ncbi:hypothetical protein RYX36_001169, partial [Vicia faba]
NIHTNHNTWQDRTTINFDMMFATVYAMPDAKTWVVVMRLHVTACEGRKCYRMEASNVGLDGSVNSLKLVDYGDESTLIQWSFEINPLEDVSENNLVDYLGFLYKSCINKIEGAVEAASRNVSPP